MLRRHRLIAGHTFSTYGALRPDYGRSILMKSHTWLWWLLVNYDDSLGDNYWGCEKIFWINNISMELLLCAHANQTANDIYCFYLNICDCFFFICSKFKTITFTPKKTVIAVTDYPSSSDIKIWTLWGYLWCHYTWLIYILWIKLYTSLYNILLYLTRIHIKAEPVWCFSFCRIT